MEVRVPECENPAHREFAQLLNYTRGEHMHQHHLAGSSSTNQPLGQHHLAGSSATNQALGQHHLASSSSTNQPLGQHHLASSSATNQPLGQHHLAAMLCTACGENVVQDSQDPQDCGAQWAQDPQDCGAQRAQDPRSSGEPGSSQPASSPVPALFECHQCAELHVSKKLLHTHIVQKHVTPDRRGECNTGAQWKRSGTEPAEPPSLSCEVCAEQFGARGLLRAHIARQHRELLRCPLCEKVALSMRNLKIHFLSRHGVEAWENHQFAQYEQAKEETSDPKIDPTKCGKCQCSICNRKWFSKRYELFKHVVDSHLKILPYECRHCEFQTTEKQKLLDHYLQFHPESEHRNRLRNKILYFDGKINVQVKLTSREIRSMRKTQITENVPSTKNALSARAIRRVGLLRVPVKRTEQGKRACAPCKPIRVNKSWHLAGSVKASNSQPVCQFCGDILGSDWEIANHARERHSVELRCVECGELFTSIPLLREHVVGSHGVQQYRSHLSTKLLEAEYRVGSLRVPVTCYICRREAFSTKPALVSHVTEVHLQVPGLDCLECPHTCTSVSAMLRHVQQLHPALFQRTYQPYGTRGKFGGWEPQIPGQQSTLKLNSSQITATDTGDNSTSELNSSQITATDTGDNTDQTATVTGDEPVKQLSTVEELNSQITEQTMPTTENVTGQTSTITENVTEQTSTVTENVTEQTSTVTENEFVIVESTMTQNRTVTQDSEILEIAQIENSSAQYESLKLAYACPNCPFVIYSKPALDIHLESNHSGVVEQTPRYSFPCALCKANWWTKDHLNWHLSRAHSPEVHCPVCGLGGFLSVSALKAHFSATHGARRWAGHEEAVRNELFLKVFYLRASGCVQCFLCPAFLHAKDALRQHICKVHLFAKRVCSVPSCSFVCFGSSSDLKDHILKSHPEHDPTLTAEQTPNSKSGVNSNTSLEKKREVKISKGKPSSKTLGKDSSRRKPPSRVNRPRCCTCGLRFSSLAQLNTHVEHVHPDTGLPYHCLLCPQLFYHACSMEAHWYLEHRESEPRYSRIPVQDISQQHGEPRYSRVPVQDISQQHGDPRYSRIPVQDISQQHGEPRYSRIPVQDISQQHGEPRYSRVPVQDVSQQHGEPRYSRVPVQELSHLPALAPRFCCRFCNSRFTAEAELAAHEADTRAHPSVYLCFLCEFSCESQLAAQSHMKVKHNSHTNSLESEVEVQSNSVPIDNQSALEDQINTQSKDESESIIIPECSPLGSSGTLEKLESLDGHCSSEVTEHPRLENVEQIFNTKSEMEVDDITVKEEPLDVHDNVTERTSDSTFLEAVNSMDFSFKEENPTLGLSDLKCEELSACEMEVSCFTGPGRLEESGVKEEERCEFIIEVTPRTAQLPGPFIPPPEPELRAREEARVEEALMRIGQVRTGSQLLFKCYACSKLVKSRSSLVQHILLDHLRVEPYACRYCGAKFFLWKSGVAHHVSEHAELNLGCARRFKLLEARVGGSGRDRSAEWRDKIKEKMDRSETGRDKGGQARDENREVRGKSEMGRARKEPRGREDSQTTGPGGETSTGAAVETRPDHGTARLASSSLVHRFAGPGAARIRVRCFPDLLAGSGARGRRVTSRPYPDSLPPVSGGCLPCSVQL